MNCREREHATLSFNHPGERGAVQETFNPWPLTTDRWKNEGIPAEVADNIYRMPEGELNPEDIYMNTLVTEGMYAYEMHMGFDGVKQVYFSCSLQNTETGPEGRAPVITAEDWEKLHEKAVNDLAHYYSYSAMHRNFSPLKEGRDKGDYSIRMCISGFFCLKEVMKEACTQPYKGA